MNKKNLEQIIFCKQLKIYRNKKKFLTTDCDLQTV